MAAIINSCIGCVISYCIPSRVERRNTITQIVHTSNERVWNNGRLVKEETNCSGYTCILFSSLIHFIYLLAYISIMVAEYTC